MNATPAILRERHCGWADTYRLRNGALDVRVVTAIGPRILDLRCAGGDNLLHVRASEAGGRGETAWRFRGGWRLWIAPERRSTTYEPDNAPVAVEQLGTAALRLRPPAEKGTGIQKEIDVELDDAEPCLRIIARLRNVGEAPVEYAPWSITALRPGGRAFLPLDVLAPTAFDAVRRIVLWSYARLDDPRYRVGDGLVAVDSRRVPVRAAPPLVAHRPDDASADERWNDESKIGVDSAQGWAAYLVARTLYLKRFPHIAGAPYPDGGATVETYSCAEFIELENLAPLTSLAPGAEVVAPEDWWVFAPVEVPAGAPDREALAILDPYVAHASLHARFVRHDRTSRH